MTSLLLSAVLATVTAGAPTQQSYNDAYRTAQLKGKPLMVVVSSDACPACVTLKSDTLRAMESSGDFEDVSVVVVNKDLQPELASELMQGRMIPQIIVFSQTERGWKRLQLTGYQTQGGVRSLIRRALTLGRSNS